MGLRTVLDNKVFKGQDCYSRIHSDIAAAAPSAGSYANCPAGTLVYDGTNDDWYITTVANTTWVKINA